METEPAPGQADRERAHRLKGSLPGSSVYSLRSFPREQKSVMRNGRPRYRPLRAGTGPGISGGTAEYDFVLLWTEFFLFMQAIYSENKFF